MSDPTTPDPVSVTPPDSTVTQPASGLQPNIAAALACFFSLIGGIVFLVLEKKNKFVRFYAMQSLLLGIGWFAFWFVFVIFSMVLTRIPGIGGLMGFLLGMVSLVVSLGMMALSIIMIVKAFTNKEWEVPYLGPIARKQLESGPLGKI